MRKSEAAAKDSKSLRKKSRELKRLTEICAEFERAGVDPLDAIKLYCPTVKNRSSLIKKLKPNLKDFEYAYKKWKEKHNLFNKG